MILVRNYLRHVEFCITQFSGGGGHSIVKNTGGAGSIVWGLGFWLGKIFWGSSKVLIWTIVRG